MKTLLIRIFIQHWPRKLVALILAIITWLVVNQTLTNTRNISNISVRVINLPQGKTIEGMQANGKLAKKLTLTLVGNKSVIDEITSSDIEVVIDAADKPNEWIVTVSKKNLNLLNPEIDLSQGVSRVYHPNFIIRTTKLITDQIPIIITQPIGDPPRGYQFLDVWPYRLNLTISGPEEVIKRLKAKEQKITFNLNNISKAELDELSRKSDRGDSDVISFFVPDQWKQIHLPILSENPIEIDDPQAKGLRLDFVRHNQFPISFPIPISLYFPPQHLQKYNPDNTTISQNPLLKETNGIFIFQSHLYANGVDSLFLETVKEMIEIIIIVSPQTDRMVLDWSVQFINPRLLEDKYVAILMSDVSDHDIRLMQPTLREEYLRNRFRSYMNRFQLFELDESKLALSILMKNNKIFIEKRNSPPLLTPSAPSLDTSPLN